MRRPIVIFCTLLTSHFKSNIIAIISILEKCDISIKNMNQATSDNTLIIEIIEMFLRITEYKITFCKTLLYNFKQTNNGTVINLFLSRTITRSRTKIKKK